MGRSSWIVLGLLSVLGAGAVGCGSGRTIGSGLSTAGVSLARDVQPIFTANCALIGCHGGSAPQEGQDLSAGRSSANIVNVPSTEVDGLLRVKPGDSANSYLYQKITQDEPAVGTRMPQGGTLTPQQIETIQRWIDGGALP